MPRPAPARRPGSVVIVGAGAAGFAAAHCLRTEGYQGPITMIGADPAAPYDRPNLSKDYLAGTAQPEWLPLREADWYASQHIDLKLGRAAERLDLGARRVTLDGGETLVFDALLLATGADPVRLPIPGADRKTVHYLRSVADADAIIAACAGARRAAVIGASFIGLEVAAALRTRGLEVHVVAPEAVPMARVLGPDLGAHVRRLHESHGVVFHLETTATEVTETGLTLANGAALAADIVVVGVGVRPRLTLAESAGLTVDKGVVVDACLETSAPGVYAAGDIARWPDPISGERVRVEHWVVAERQGQTAARNMLGARERFAAAPFFWSQHYDQAISYVGHAPSWDRAELNGDPATGSCEVVYYAGGRKLAVATLGRDHDSLCAEVAFEKAIGAL
jgi:apoptosis-inducing factor 3